jgi:hypothetical protein
MRLSHFLREELHRERVVTGFILSGLPALEVTMAEVPDDQITIATALMEAAAVADELSDAVTHLSETLATSDPTEVDGLALALERLRIARRASEDALRQLQELGDRAAEARANPGCQPDPKPVTGVLVRVARNKANED